MPRRTSEMSKCIITEISDDQYKVLASYREKWKMIATLTQPIDKERVAKSIRSAYVASNYSEPEILFFGSPFAAIKEIIATENFRTYLGKDIRNKFQKRCFDHVHHLIERQLNKNFYYNLRNQIDYPEFPDHLDQNSNPKAFHFPGCIESCVEAQIMKDLNKTEADYSNISELLMALNRPVRWSSLACMFDFCISALGLQHDHKKWIVVKELMQNCDFMFQFENVCIACDRPNKLLFDQKNLLHAEGETALQFVDGYGVYAYHGGERPEGRRCKNGEYISPGTKVKLPITGEYGIVAHCWYSDQIYDFDCYVAFFGTSFPDQETECRPYILRYAAVSLEILE
jgi:hypothetical protein